MVPLASVADVSSIKPFVGADWGIAGPTELLWKWGGWMVTQSGGAENTFFSVTL